ncbi:unnamed protein product [Didymodactylos carnosus]|uniref:Uncharacterized protein n=1 Tax=Didymodactylos carnosus TaxID=1234261 RepID=A0A8S2SN45_9BILA|nr:unnamed protein product [Didymodactylos carnosus]CAF4231312.1 unnamed protein product [Didymodactylos carnosus]
MDTTQNSSFVNPKYFLDYKRRRAIIPSPNQPNRHSKYTFTMFEDNNLTTEQDIPSKTSINNDKDSQDGKQQQGISSTVSYNNSKSNEREKASTSDEGEQSEGNNAILHEKMLNAQTKGDEDFDTFILKNNFKPFDGNQNVITWLNETEEKFNHFKLNRFSRPAFVPLLVINDAKRWYIRCRREIHTFDDFYESIFQEYNQSSPSLTTSSTLHPSKNVFEKRLTFHRSKSEERLNVDKIVAENMKVREPLHRSTTITTAGAVSSFGVILARHLSPSTVFESAKPSTTVTFGTSEIYIL